MPLLDEIFKNPAFSVTAIIAIYGAMLSTAIFINNWIKDRPNLIIKVEIDFIDPENLGSSPEGLKVTCINIGTKTVTVGKIIIEEIDKSKSLWSKLKIGKELQKNKRYISSITPNGIEILSGKSQEYFIDPEKLQMVSDISLEKSVIAIAIDQTENQFRSKPFHV